MKKLTDITILLDKSGSMESIKNATINGFNTFLSEQKETNGKVRLSLAQFNHGYQLLYEGIKIKKAPQLNSESFEPEGLTALLDAIGKTIKLTCERIKNLDKKKQPSNVVIVIITDGLENNSRKFTRKQIFQLIEKMQSKQWEFVFLGANQDAIQEAHNYNILEKKAMTFAADNDGVEDVFYSLSEAVDNFVYSDGEFKLPLAAKEKQKRD